MPYPEQLCAPMRKELTSIGFTELKDAAQVDATIPNSKGTLLLVMNSVCGCAAGAARPDHRGGKPSRWRRAGRSQVRQGRPAGRHHPAFHRRAAGGEPGRGGMGDGENLVQDALDDAVRHGRIGACHIVQRAGADGDVEDIGDHGCRLHFKAELGQRRFDDLDRVGGFGVLIVVEGRRGPSSADLDGGGPARLLVVAEAFHKQADEA